MEEGEDSQTKLTHRETEVLQMIAEGLKSREIAKRLFVSIKTVDTHRANIREKLNIQSTADLVQYAIHKGLIIKDL
ncbi:MAG: helix-turn-helix transcriptional regulator [Desulfobacula sp.]|jgi:two-component system response regulator NreC|nr:helix-turn-helix transcriptional regulator [Desulfobacula sp.]